MTDRGEQGMDAYAGMSLSDYLPGGVRKSAEAPTMDKFLARLAARKPVKLSQSPLKILREQRDRR